MRIFNKNLIIGAAFAISCGTAPAADVGSDLRNFWENSGGGVNVSAPTFYQGQRAGFATLGSVQVRTRNRQSALAHIQLPSVRAGCGGIDVFGGSFSFISKEELIKLMEAIMQNAAGFACQWQFKFPHFGQSKIPQFCGVRVSAVFSDLQLHFWVDGHDALGRAAV